MQVWIESWALPSLRKCLTLAPNDFQTFPKLSRPLGAFYGVPPRSFPEEGSPRIILGERLREQSHGRFSLARFGNHLCRFGLRVGHFRALGSASLSLQTTSKPFQTFQTSEALRKRFGGLDREVCTSELQVKGLNPKP